VSIIKNKSLYKYVVLSKELTFLDGENKNRAWREKAKEKEEKM
jgi:hypothetical protein